MEQPGALVQVGRSERTGKSEEPSCPPLYKGAPSKRPWLCRDWLGLLMMGRATGQGGICILLPELVLGLRGGGGGPKGNSPERVRLALLLSWVPLLHWAAWELAARTSVEF